MSPRESVDSLENFVAKMPTLRRQNLIQNTLSAVSSAGTSGYSSEVAEVKEDEASPGQEVEVRRLGEESHGLSFESQSSDTTLVPEDGSEDRGRSSRQGREEGREGRGEGRRPRQRSHNRRSQEWGRMLDLERRARSGDRGAKGDTKGDTKGVREPRSRSRSREADRQASFSPTFMESMARSLDRKDSEAEVTQL